MLTTNDHRGGRPARTLEFRGEQRTAKEIAKLAGRSQSWVSRHSDGIKVIEPSKNAYSDPETHEHWPTYFHAGVRDTLAGWSRRTGIPLPTLRSRLMLGWPLKRALSEPVNTASTITFKGRTMTRSEWAKECGLPPHTLRVRFLKGWSVERTLTTPLQQKRTPGGIRKLLALHRDRRG